MLVIRQEQLEAFRNQALANFEDEMVAHGTQFSPRLCALLGDKQTRVAVRRALMRAGSFGFTNRGPLRLFTELAFLFGSGFYNDPQYPWAAQILKSPDDQMHRAQQLYDRTIDYQEKVSGVNAVNTRTDLQNVSIFARGSVTFSADSFLRAMLQAMAQIFPEKAAYVGEEALGTLTREGSAVARRYQIPNLRGEVLIIAMMFSFGHACADDPLYEWISRTLKDDRIVGPAARAARLERKALTWLDHVLQSLAQPE
jgi:hypothetical protein